MTEARTMGFTILVFAQLFNALSSRSHLQSAFVGLFSNKWLWGAIGLSVALQLVVIYVPFLNGPFGTVALSPRAWVECICLGRNRADCLRTAQDCATRDGQALSHRNSPDWWAYSSGPGSGIQSPAHCYIQTAPHGAVTIPMGRR